MSGQLSNSAAKPAAAVSASRPTKSGSVENLLSQRRDHAAVLLDQGKIFAVLPDREGLALLQRDLDRAGIDLAHRDVLDPGQFGKLAAGLVDVERDQRGRAVEVEALENVDLRRLAVAGNLHVLDGKAHRGRRGFGEILRMAAEGHAVKARRAEEQRGRDAAGVARDMDAAGRKADEEADDAAQRARQHAAGFRLGKPDGTHPRLSDAQRKHDASSTIQLKNSPKEWPAWTAISGTSEVGVMPGWVLTSSQISSPFSEKRSS